jgi:hypothetical protein
MAEVYRAEDATLGQTVALKLLPERLARDERRLGRLRDEVRIARGVSHPNVCRVYDISEADGVHFISMEWIEGEDLDAVLRRGGPLPAERALSAARQICAGLAAAHERQVLHRDLKPANVMLDERGVARITDFGLAEAGAAVRGERAREGTPRYMAPEQYGGREATVQSDLYALGLILYEIFTGRPGYPGATLEELHEQRRSPPPPPSSLTRSIDPAVEKLILRCLQPDPARRPGSAREVLAALPGGEAVGGAAAAAQQRADRIAAFRAELAELRQAGLIRLETGELEAVECYHERALRDLVERFDVDVSERGKQLSLGMRAISLVAAIALAASVYYFFYRIWGLIATPLQVGILAGTPVLALLLTAAIARREAARYFTGIAALAALTCVIVDTTMLEQTFNLEGSPLSVLAWGALALLLAYGFRLPLLLAVALPLLASALAAGLHAHAGGNWPDFLQAPECLFPGGALLAGVALWTQRRQPPGFAAVHLLMATIVLIAPALLIGLSASVSYLPLERHGAETLYQILGFLLSAGAIGAGIARRSREAVYTGTAFFAAFLFLKYVHWFWDWMPRYLFFLIVALSALGMVLVLRRLRAVLGTRRAEAPA